MRKKPHIYLRRNFFTNETYWVINYQGYDMGFYRFNNIQDISRSWNIIKGFLR